jgi:hypothetical protein
MRFDRTLIEQAGGDWSSALYANSALDELSAILVHQIETAEYPDSKIAWKFACLHQALAYRVVDLAEATILLWTNKRWLMSVIGARSMLETTALIHYVVSEIEKAVEARDITKLDAIAMQQTFSMRKGDAEFPATQILTAIDRATKVLPEFRELYELLSEYAHPNSDGHYFFFADLDVNQHVTRFSRDKRGSSAIKFIASAFTSIGWAQHRLDELTKLLGTIVAFQSTQ